jgi:hypothetical protein
MEDLEKITEGQKAYEFYYHAVDGKSIHGEPLPEWLDVPAKIKVAWEYTAESIIQNWLAKRRGE